MGLNFKTNNCCMIVHFNFSSEFKVGFCLENEGFGRWNYSVHSKYLHIPLYIKWIQCTKTEKNN